jgi:DNA-directed RNA polymerase specialized sigma24 family protein
VKRPTADPAIPDAQDRFCLEARPQLLAFLARQYPRVSRDDLEDLVQQAFLLFIRYSRTHEVRFPRALLERMARCAANTFIRRGRRLVRLDEGPAEAACDRIEAPPALSCDGPELAALLLTDWLARHRPEDLPLFLLRLQFLSTPEIAARTGLTPEAVRKRFSRAFEAIRSHDSIPGLDDCLDAWNEERSRA